MVHTINQSILYASLSRSLSPSNILPSRMSSRRTRAAFVSLGLQSKCHFLIIRRTALPLCDSHAAVLTGVETRLS